MVSTVATIVVTVKGERMTETIDVPGRVRVAREGRGLTQRDLARRAGLSHTTIAKIERGEINPTIASLQKIAVALRSTVAVLLSGGDEEPDRHVFRRAELATVALGAHTIRQIGRHLGGHALQMMEDTYAPGADTGETMLSHAGEEAGFVVRGRLELTVGGTTETLETGDAYRFESRLPHRFRNVGDEDCVVIAAATPPSL